MRMEDTSDSWNSQIHKIYCGNPGQQFCASSVLERHKCEYCKFHTNLKVILNEHNKVFHEKLENNSVLPRILDCYKCIKCDYKTYSLLVLIKHLTTCKFMKYENEAAKSHYEKYTEETATGARCWIYHGEGGGRKPVLGGCDQCGFEAYTLLALANHIRTCDWMNEKPMNPCWIIPKGKEENAYRKRELFLYKCEKCAFQTKALLTLSRHAATCDFGKYNEATKSDGKPLFDCELCTDTLKWECDCGRHLLCKHTACRYSTSENVQWSFCKYCQCKFKDNSALKKHISQQLFCEDCSECKRCPCEVKDENSVKTDLAELDTSTNDVNWCNPCAVKDENSVKTDLAELDTSTNDVNWLQSEQCHFASQDRNILEIYMEEHPPGRSIICSEHNYCKTDHNCFNQNEKPAFVRWYKCGYCNFKTKNEDMLYRHLELEHFL